MPSILSCRHLIDSLDGYLDGSLAWHQQGVVGFHLLFCYQCRRYLKSYKTSQALARRAFADLEQEARLTEKSLPPGLAAAIMRACK